MTAGDSWDLMTLRLQKHLKKLRNGERRKRRKSIRKSLPDRNENANAPKLIARPK